MEWGISLSMRKRPLLPKGFLWRLSLLNILVVATVIIVSGLAIYNTACFLVDTMGNLNDARQRRFNATLMNYLWIFSITVIVTGSLLHFYLTKKIIGPIRNLIDSTKRMKMGEYPEPAKVTSRDEIGELAEHFNELIQQLHSNDQYRQKLVADLSHELRTPLTNLNGYLQSLERGDIEGDRKLYHSLYQESNRLTVMMEQLEQLKEWDSLASQSHTKNEEANIADIIDQSAAMFTWRLEQEKLTLEVKADSTVLSIHVEGIQQVISNLLENAINYYDGKSPIKVIGESQKKGFNVSVSGPGKFIPEAERSNIFERFYRLDESRSRVTGGSGLGLAIAKEIIERHGGEIGVSTRSNQNVFWFTLPVS